MLMETRQWNQKDGVKLSLLLIYEHIVNKLHSFVDRPDYQWQQQSDISVVCKLFDRYGGEHSPMTQ